MSRAEVSSIFGRGPDAKDYILPGNVEHFNYWKVGDDYIVVAFQFDCVYYKQLTVTSRNNIVVQVWTQLRLWLGL
jgi:hypothetical protein